MPTLKTLTKELRNEMMSIPTLNRQGYYPLKQDDQTIHDVDQNECQQEHTDNKRSTDDETINEDLMSQNRHKSSVWKTTLNMLNYMEGVGFLALPYAVHRGGITAVIGFVVVPLVMGYTASLLVECLYEINEDGEKIRVRSSYQEIGQHCWAPLKPISSVIVSASCFITTASYLVLFSSLMSHYFPGIPLTQIQWVCLAIGVVLPSVFLRKLSQIAWLSVLGLIALLSSVCLTLTYEFQQVHKWDIESVMFWDTQGIFIALNITFFSYQLHFVLITIEGDMTDKSKFNIALVSCYSTGAVIKVVFAVAGFLTYTLTTNEVILNNLPSGIPTMVIATLFSFNVLLTFPIPFLVVVRNIEETSLYTGMTEKIHPKICFAFIRIVLVLFSLVFAVAIPHFALITALDGCCGYLSSLIFPGVFHLIIRKKGLTPFQVFSDCFIIIFGVIGMSLGLVETVKQLVLA